MRKNLEDGRLKIGKTNDIDVKLIEKMVHVAQEGCFDCSVTVSNVSENLSQLFFHFALLSLITENV
jgi:hypothetical protein